jgi:hypothetical protein
VWVGFTVRPKQYDLEVKKQMIPTNGTDLLLVVFFSLTVCGDAFAEEGAKKKIRVMVEQERGNDSGFQLWSTMANGFDFSDLGTSNVAVLSTTRLGGFGSADFGLISVSGVIPEPSRALLSLVGIAAIGLRRRRS